MTTIIVSAAVGLVATLVTAFVTSWLTARNERAKAEWQEKAEREKGEREAKAAKERLEREMAAQERGFHERTMLGYAEARAKEPAVARSVAQNQAVAVLRFIPVQVGTTFSSAMHTVFLPPNIRFTIGRAATNDVVLGDTSSNEPPLEDPDAVSRVHCAVLCTRAECRLEVFSRRGVVIEGKALGEGTYPIGSGSRTKIGGYFMVLNRLNGSGFAP